jgi:hypothetical protein
VEWSVGVVDEQEEFLQEAYQEDLVARRNTEVMGDLGLGI